jgi:hypothetical protein
MKTVATRYDIRKTTKSGAIGESISEDISSVYVISKYPINVFPVAIVILPINPIMLPIPLVITKELEFFKASTNAAMADWQKFSPVRAT